MQPSPEVTPRISSAERIGYLRNTIDPMYPTIVVTIPHNIATIVTFTTSLNPNKTRSPGIGDAVPGALLTSWNREVIIPASAPPTKFVA